MSSFNYTTLGDFKEPHMVLSGNNIFGKLASPDGQAGRTILMSRTDFNIKIIEMPPLPADQITNMLRYRIRGLYPGDPENTVFDHEVVSFDNKKYAVLFITSREILESYKRLGEKNRLILPFHLMKKRIVTCREPNRIFLFWHSHWIDVFSLKDGLPVASNAVKRSHSVRLDLQKVKKILPKYADPCSFMVYAAADEITKINETLESVFDEPSIEQQAFDDLFQIGIPRREALFGAAPLVKLPSPSRRLAIYGVAAALLLIVLFVRSSDQLYRYRDFLQERQRALSARSTELSVMLKDVSALEKEYTQLIEKKPGNIYLLLSRLSEIFPRDTVIQSFIVRNDVFQLEGTGSNPLLVEEALKKNGYFKEIEMTEMKPVANSSRQFFRMKGIFLNASAQ